jgi:hypothetical protein
MRLASPPGVLPRLISPLVLQGLLELPQLSVVQAWAYFRLLGQT